jgi:ATP-binding protein involved in chromosome partitioning
MPTQADVLEALRPVEDPEIHQSIVDLEMVRGIAIEGDRVRSPLPVARCGPRSRSG